MKTFLILMTLSFSSLALAQVDGKCDLTAKKKLEIKLVGESFQIRLNKLSCNAVVTSGMNIDRGPQQKEILYVDLASCDQKVFRKEGFIKFEKLSKSVTGLANLVLEGPVACEFKANWDKLREISAKHP